MTEPRRPALLLLGPTGSGKTPLGQQIEARGFRGLKCAHFDFGDNLRDVVVRNCPDKTVGSQDIEFLRNVLASGALLEDEYFPLAERVLLSFLQRRGVDAATWVVLNGLPRHIGQAEAIDAVLDVRTVVCLECSSETVLERLANNVGGDRGGRIDDTLADVRRKLGIYHQRTMPLIEHYRRRGTPIKTIPISPSMTAQEAWMILSGST